MVQDTLTGRNVAILVTDGFDLNWPRGGETKHKMGFLGPVLLCLCLVVSSVSLCRAQGSTLKYEVDPTWPKPPLPDNWVTGQVSGVCVDSQDHVFIVNRDDTTDKEAEVSRQASPFIEFNSDRTDMPTPLSDVRCWGQSGKHLLAASISPFDPERTFVKRTHPLQAICTTRTVADADARNPND
jgi:hypothetical protein